MARYPHYGQPKVGESVQFTDFDGTLRAALVMRVDTPAPVEREHGVDGPTPILTLAVAYATGANLKPGVRWEYVEQVPHAREATEPSTWRHVEEGVAVL